jgi:phenylacetate-CoA ligase
MLNLSSQLYSLYHRTPVPVKNLMAAGYSLWSSGLKYGGTFREWREFLEKSQWWDAGRLREYQQEQLSLLLTFVYENSLFCRSVMQERGIQPNTKETLASFGRLPIIDKNTVRSQYEDIKTQLAGPKKLILSTSGTTGMALQVPMTKETFQREYAFRWQFQSVAGAKKGDRFAYFTGHNIFQAQRTRPPYWIRNHAENSIMFSLYHMAEDTLGDYLEAFNRFQPEFVSGYPSGIYVLASYAISRAKAVSSPRAIFTASETLHEHQRAVIEQAFGAPIFQWFGQVETTVNIHECNHHRLHVKEEYGLLEILKDDGTEAQPGEIGDVVATGWGNKAFPLIRYNTGDNMSIARNQSCPCGRGGRLIEKIWGRDEDFVVTPEGRYVGRLDFVFKPVSTVRESQIIQEDMENLCVRIVPLPGYTSRDEEVLTHMLRDRIGNAMRIRFECVAEIPRQQNGKMRYVVSHVGQQRYVRSN